MFANGDKSTMNRDNISALIIAIALVVGFNQAWSLQQQKDEGLVVGGVHSPEFQSEKNYTNMKNAMQTGITHPVITVEW